MENNTYKIADDQRITIYTRVISNTPLLGIVFKVQIKFPIKKGVAHLTEHLICNQSLNLKNLVVRGNTTTNNISIEVLGMEKDVQKRLSDIINGIIDPSFSNTQFIREKKVVLQEINDYKTQRLYNFANIARNRLFNNNHDEDDGILGSLNDLSMVTVKDVHKFIRTNFYSNNLRILVSGSHVQRVVSRIRKIKFDLRDSYEYSSIENNGDVKDVLNKIDTINYVNKSVVARISYTKRISLSNLNKSKVIAMSVLLEKLTGNGNLSIRHRLKQKLQSIYFVRIVPIYRYDNIYFQILSSCSVKDCQALISIIDEIFNNLSNAGCDNIDQNLKNYMALQYSLLFDGVEKSMHSFSSMEREQEKIIDLYDVNWDDVKMEFIDLVSGMTKNRNILIDYK